MLHSWTQKGKKNPLSWKIPFTLPHEKRAKHDSRWNTTADVEVGGACHRPPFTPWWQVVVTHWLASSGAVPAAAVVIKHWQRHSGETGALGSVINAAATSTHSTIIVVVTFSMMRWRRGNCHGLHKKTFAGQNLWASPPVFGRCSHSSSSLKQMWFMCWAESVCGGVSRFLVQDNKHNTNTVIQIRYKSVPRKLAK